MKTNSCRSMLMRMWTWCWITLEWEGQILSSRPCSLQNKIKMKKGKRSYRTSLRRWEDRRMLIRNSYSLLSKIWRKRSRMCRGLFTSRGGDRSVCSSCSSVTICSSKGFRILIYIKILKCSTLISSSSRCSRWHLKIENENIKLFTLL